MPGKNLISPRTSAAAPASRNDHASDGAAPKPVDVRSPFVSLGAVTGFDAAGCALVEIDGREAEGALAALCASDDLLEAGALVVLAWVDGDPRRPVIVGRLQPPRTKADDRDPKVVIEADQRLTLRCGEASLELTREGKVVVRGESVVTHARGVNRIKGGSVQIN